MFIIIVIFMNMLFSYHPPKQQQQHKKKNIFFMYAHLCKHESGNIFVSTLYLMQWVVIILQITTKSNELNMNICRESPTPPPPPPLLPQTCYFLMKIIYYHYLIYLFLYFGLKVILCNILKTIFVQILFLYYFAYAFFLFYKICNQFFFFLIYKIYVIK